MSSSERLLLPFELIEEILRRTSAESLIRFTSTCKKWYALITKKTFIYNHLDHSPERFIRIDNEEIMDPVTRNCSVSPFPEEFRRQQSLYYMVHCDGLMLYMCSEWICKRTKDPNLAIWNPVTRKIKWIEPSDRYGSFDYFGIGYYKILRLSGCIRDRKIEIYELNSDSWRTIDAKFDVDVVAKSDPEVDAKSHLEIFTDCEGVSVKGNMLFIFYHMC